MRDRVSQVGIKPPTDDFAARDGSAQGAAGETSRTGSVSGGPRAATPAAQRGFAITTLGKRGRPPSA